MSTLKLEKPELLEFYEVRKMSWLDELKVGSEVFLENRFNKEIGFVSRFTPKTIIINDKYVFNKSDGHSRGSKVFDLLQLTPESKKQFLIERERLKKVRWLSYNYNKLSDDQLVAVYDFLHQNKGE